MNDAPIFWTYASSSVPARYVPPPELVPKPVDEWLAGWHERHRALSS